MNNIDMMEILRKNCFLNLMAENIMSSAVYKTMKAKVLYDKTLSINVV